METPNLTKVIKRVNELDITEQINIFDNASIQYEAQQELTRLTARVAELEARLQFLVNDLAPDVDGVWEAYDKAVELLKASK